MKRCKAETSRACDSIECTLEDGHQGAHEGRRGTDRAIWDNPEAPYYEPLEPVPPTEPETPAALALTVTLPSPSMPPPASFVPGVQTPTRCACGTDHGKTDPEFRTVGGFPVAAWHPIDGKADADYAWPRVCRGCGAVYCLIWSGQPSILEPVCICPLSERKQAGFEHSRFCPISNPK